MNRDGGMMRAQFNSPLGARLMPVQKSSYAPFCNATKMRDWVLWMLRVIMQAYAMQPGSGTLIGTLLRHANWSRLSPYHRRYASDVNSVVKSPLALWDFGTQRARRQQDVTLEFTLLTQDAWVGLWTLCSSVGAAMIRIRLFTLWVTVCSGGIKHMTPVHAYAVSMWLVSFIWVTHMSRKS